jgi:uncharacterized delta-60 repeat protein
MRIIFTPFLLVLFFISKAQDGSLDVFNYGTSGKEVTGTPLPVVNEQQRIFILTSDANKILHSFTSNNAGTDDFGVAEYDESGAVVTTFGTSGFVTTNFGGDDHAYGMTVSPSSQIIQVGTSINTSTSVGSFAIARYSSGGVLDASFDGDGKNTTLFAGYEYAVATSVVQNGTVIYVGGYSQNATTHNTEFALARYQSSNGAFIGVTTTAIGTNAQINAIALQPDGKIVAAGYTLTGGVYQFALARYNSDGSLDASGFGTSGIVTTQVLTNNDVAYDVAVQSTGNIVAVGSAHNGTNLDFAIARYSSGGVLDVSFDGDGKQTIPVGAGNDVAYSVAIQSDGKVLVAGTTTGTTNDFAITRLNTDGSIDASNFGETSPGFTIIDFTGTSNDQGYDIALGNNYIMFGGYSDNALGTARMLNSSVILPVHLISFTASRLSNLITLNWQSANEKNVQSFEIQRSSDGIRFTKIGSITAAGNSNYIKNYSFEDQQPTTINFYRLRVINTDNSVEYSNIIVVRFENSVSLQAFPNPVRNSLNLQITQPKGRINIQLFDVSGRLVKAVELESSGSTISTSINVSNLIKGVYLLKANDQVIKLVKE